MQTVSVETKWGKLCHVRRPAVAPVWTLTCVYAVVCLELVFEAESLPAAVALVGLLSRVDALVAPQRAVVSEAAPAELALERVVTWKCSRVTTEARAARLRPARLPGAAQKGEEMYSAHVDARVK